MAPRRCTSNTDWPSCRRLLKTMGASWPRAWETDTRLTHPPRHHNFKPQDSATPSEEAAIYPNTNYQGGWGTGQPRKLWPREKRFCRVDSDNSKRNSFQRSTNDIPSHEPLALHPGHKSCQENCRCKSRRTPAIAVATVLRKEYVQ